MTGERMRMFSIDNVECGLCGKYLEITLRVFRDCSLMKSMWDRVIPMAAAHDFFLHGFAVLVAY